MNNPAPFVFGLLNNPPRSGEGLHRWLFRTARHLHGHFSEAEICNLLRAKTANCGRRVSDDEIRQAVENSRQCASFRRAASPHWKPGAGASYARTHTTPPPRRWPCVDRQAQARAIQGTDQGLPDLWEASPIRLLDDEPQTEAIIDALFPGNPLLCCGWSETRFETQPREAWRGQLAQMQFIVPSPMRQRTGLNQDGKRSARCLDNTGARRFLICEFDAPELDADKQAALLLHLSEYAPLVAVVYSGGKSYHGWFYVHGHPEQQVERFFKYACKLGCDPATWTLCQSVRLPDGLRDNGKRQTVFFLNYHALGK